LFNRVLQGGYEPGSTLKPFIALAGLQAGLITPSDTVWSTGEFRMPGQDIGFRDWRAGGHGRVNLREAMAQSVNTYFYQLGLDLGIDRMSSFLGRLGFGVPTGIDLPAETSGVLPSREWKRQRFDQPWYPGETVIAAIGQGYNVSSILQLAVATAALANGGERVRPQLLRATQSRLDGALEPAPRSAAEPVGITDPAHLAAVIDSMHAVVQGPTGTARAVGLDAAYQFAGKTGTAQRSSRNREAGASSVAATRNQALFVAFAPLDQPEIALALVVEAGDSGSRTAAPMARAILDAWLLRDRGTPE
jgi:penicillin-binding protein 2